LSGSWARAVSALGFLALGALGARADMADPADVAAGMKLFRAKANCQTCHGWAGDGRKMDSQMPDGANLRETQLDRKTLVATIRCGRPGTGMPAFDRLAYSDGRCYGMKAADLEKSGMTLTDPPATLAAREIDLIADFLFAKVVGKGAMNHARCLEYWGGRMSECDEFKD
jgi:Cytochrome C oxidase, cbb3-type, subunit III